MKTVRPLIRSLALHGLLAMLLLGCMKDEPSSPAPQGTEVENEIVGRLLYADGSAAVGAKVRIYPVEEAPLPAGAPKTGRTEGLAYSTTTDDKGFYYVDSMSRGEYNVLGEDNGLVSYLDSIYLKADGVIIPTDTLRDPGSVQGFVSLQPQDHLRRTSIIVQVLGTNFYVNVNDSGFFSLPTLAQGTYSIRVSTTLPDYAPLFTTVTAVSGRKITLPDTLRLRYSGIPIVTGLKVAYDTLNGMAGLTWNRSAFPGLVEYWVYRAPAGDLLQMETLVARLTGNSWSETIFKPSSSGGWISPDFQIGAPEAPDAYPHGPFPIPAFEYTVRIRDRSQQIGPVYESAMLQAPPPSTVKTYIDMQTPGFPGAVVSINDTVTLIGNYANLTRTQVKASWYLDGVQIKTSPQNKLRGSDTLMVVSPSAPGIQDYRFQVTDDSGHIWSAANPLNTQADPPVVFAGRDTMLFLGSVLKLHPSIQNRFAKIVKWEWDFGNTGAFTSTSGPDTTITLPVIPDLVYPCVLRVTDEDGESARDTLEIRITNTYLKSPMPTRRGDFSTVTANGKIYAIGGRNNAFAALTAMEEFDPSADVWRKLPSMSLARRGAGAVVYLGKIYVIGGTDEDGSEQRRVEVYDLATETWSLGPIFPTNQKLFGLWNDKIYLWEHQNSPNPIALNAFDPVLGGLQRVSEGAVANPPKGMSGNALRNWDFKPVIFDGKAYLFGNEAEPSFVFAYHFQTGIWAYLAPMPNPPLGDVRYALGGGVIYAAGGFDWLLGENIVVTTVSKFNLTTNLWTPEPGMGIARKNVSSIFQNGKLYILGGFNPLTGWQDAVEEYLP